MDMKKGKNSLRILPVVFLMLGVCMTASVAPADPLEPQTVLNAYKSGEKSCKQIERDYEKMKGQYEMMFKSWQEKSIPLLTEDKELLTKCKDSISTLNKMLEEIEKTGPNDPESEKDKLGALKIQYEKIQNVIKTIMTRHKSLEEEHERIFHEMMGH